MQSVVRRPVFGFALGIVTAGLVFAGGIAYGAATQGEISACSKKSVGTLYLAGDKGCLPGDSAVSWSIQGPQGEPGPPGPKGDEGPSGPAGPAGTFSGSFQSPNGQYSISVADSGIELRGPGGGRVRLESGNLILQGNVGLQINAPIVSMNGGCSKVMRQTASGITPSNNVSTC